MPANSQQLEKDEIFEVLSNGRRRQLLFLLYTDPDVTKLSDLAREIANREANGTADNDQYKRLYISLYQTHVPKLEEYGIVTYDPDTKEVELTDRIEQIIQVFSEEHEPRSWWRYYLAIAGITFAVFIVYWTGFRANEVVASLVVIVPLVLLTIVVMLHYRDVTRERDDPVDRLIA